MITQEAIMASVPLGSNPDWWEYAACHGVGNELFFTDEIGQMANQEVQAAKAVCAKCPVRAECLEYGIDEKHGVWGGRSPKERQAIRKHRYRFQ